MSTVSLEQKLKMRATVNEWLSKSFPTHRKHLLHVPPIYSESDQAWAVDVTTRQNGKRASNLGRLLITDDASIIDAPDPESVLEQLLLFLAAEIAQQHFGFDDELIVNDSKFILGDGIEGASHLPDRSIDLLLTDPPYGISRRYTSESQVPRRLRKNGTDFIMPKGFFGDWDRKIDPPAWTNVVLPKINGWAVIFCAQAQIGEYTEILKSHKFVAVGTLVWQKTNPVPFNHKYKPVNAWEALVVGKRPGTKFHGKLVHNVFVCKSPSPQQRIHPTQKPLSLVKEFVDLFSYQGELVFDPFAGSATTMIAALQSGRRALAYEKDPRIFQLACERILELKDAGS
ncbi:MAG: site-specific DNA-methyltransferase [Anaerolineaceae bacterium]|nr:site-specific DNA-methyltransferase [Anaerolineaceae bacterium]